MYINIHNYVHVRHNIMNTIYYTRVYILITQHASGGVYRRNGGDLGELGRDLGQVPVGVGDCGRVR